MTVTNEVPTHADGYAGYWVEKFRASYGNGNCYCTHRAVGVTVFWDGSDMQVREHCGDHLPKASATYQGSVRCPVVKR